MKKYQKEFKPPVFIGQNVYIKPSYLVSIPEFYYENKQKSLKFEQNEANLKNNSNGGKLSSKAQKGVRNAINWLLVSAKQKRVFSAKNQRNFLFKVSLITLTLPDTTRAVNNSDFQKLLLNPFLVYLRKYQGLKNYVWKLELQKNGKLHAHITIDCFVHWRNLRAIWNRLLNRHSLLEDFKNKWGHSNPNSTDIHSIKKVKNLAAYIAKYMSKTEDAIKDFKGRIWSCSYELSRANKAMVHIPADQCADNLKCLMSNQIEWKNLTVQPDPSKPPRVFAELFFIKAVHWQSTLKGLIKQKFNEVRQSISAFSQHFTQKEFELT